MIIKYNVYNPVSKSFVCGNMIDFDVLEDVDKLFFVRCLVEDTMIDIVELKNVLDKYYYEEEIRDKFKILTDDYYSFMKVQIRALDRGEKVSSIPLTPQRPKDSALAQIEIDKTNETLSCTERVLLKSGIALRKLRKKISILMIKLSTEYIWTE